MAALLLLAKTMFPEGQQRMHAVRKDGAAAPLVNALIVNAKDAIDELWKAETSSMVCVGLLAGAAQKWWFADYATF